MMKEPRQVRAIISAPTIGGVTALAEARAGVRDALREAAFAGGNPTLLSACRSREGGAFAEAEQDAGEKERDETVDQAGQNRRDRPDDAAPEESLARSKFVADPAANNLEEKIRPRESGKYETEFGMAEAQIFLHDGRRHADVHPVDVSNEVHDAEQSEDALRRLQPNSHIFLPT